MIDAPAAKLVIDTDVTIQADANRLQQLFENLFRNAVEHGRPDVTINVCVIDDRVGLYVADTGDWIPQSEWADALEPG